MSVPEFKAVQEAAKELQEEMKTDGPSMPGTLGKARVF